MWSHLGSRTICTKHFLKQIRVLHLTDFFFYVKYHRISGIATSRLHLRSAVIPCFAPPHHHPMPLATCIDLFAGTGAFSHVLRKYGMKCVFANDMEKSSQAIYEANHPDGVFLKQDLNDIVATDIPSHDVLCGGFPCQPFSIAGQQKRVLLWTLPHL